MLGSKFNKFLRSILKPYVNCSTNLASFFIVMTYNSCVNFRLIPFLLWIKGSHQNANFETFDECSDENLPNSSCHFPNHKSVFLQILHHSSVSSKITPLYFFSLNIIYFGQKDVIKVHVFETFKCLGQNSSNSSCQLWNHISIFIQILHNSFVSWDITSLYFFSLIHFPQKELSKYKFGEISRERSKVWHFTIWWIPFVQII